MASVRPVEVAGRHGAMRGFAHEPHDHIAGVVVVVHGYFSGTGIGPARFFVELAEQLAPMNLATWRIDRCGAGNSDGEFAEVSYDDQVEDTSRILLRALEEYRAPVHVVGHSAGCAIAIRALQAANLRPASLHCLAPTVNSIESDEKFFSPSQVRELKETGSTERNGYTVMREYLEQMRDTSFLKGSNLLSGIPGAVYFGSEDHVWGKAGAIPIVDSLGLHLHEIPRADHNLLPSSARLQLSRLLEQSMCRGHGVWRSIGDVHSAVVSSTTRIRRSIDRGPAPEGSATAARP